MKSENTVKVKVQSRVIYSVLIDTELEFSGPPSKEEIYEATLDYADRLLVNGDVSTDIDFIHVDGCPL